MSGTAEGAKKAHETKIKRDPAFYSRIGRLSWKNSRSHRVGFANLDQKTHREISARGGRKTKDQYKKEANTITEDNKTSTGVSE